MRMSSGGVVPQAADPDTMGLPMARRRTGITRATPRIVDRVVWVAETMSLEQKSRKQRVCGDGALKGSCQVFVREIRFAKFARAWVFACGAVLEALALLSALVRRHSVTDSLHSAARVGCQRRAWKVPSWDANAGTSVSPDSAPRVVCSCACRLWRSSSKLRGRRASRPLGG